jgi:hypothetical protein
MLLSIFGVPGAGHESELHHPRISRGADAIGLAARATNLSSYDIWRYKTGPSHGGRILLDFLSCLIFFKNYTVQRRCSQHAHILTPMNTHTQPYP